MLKDYSILPDDDLLQMLKQNDKAAFTEIYNRYWQNLFVISYNFSKHRETAEEVVQDIFISLWDKRHHVDILDLGAYLATACKFAVFKNILKNKRRKELLEQNVSYQLSVDEEGNIDNRFLKEYINRTVERLPEKCQAVYHYSREKNYSIREIAEILSISTKTVESHLTKALKILRMSIKNL